MYSSMPHAPTKCSRTQKQQARRFEAAGLAPTTAILTFFPSPVAIRYCTVLYYTVLYYTSHYLALTRSETSARSHLRRLGRHSVGSRCLRFSNRRAVGQCSKALLPIEIFVIIAILVIIVITIIIIIRTTLIFLVEATRSPGKTIELPCGCKESKSDYLRPQPALQSPLPVVVALTTSL